MHCDVDSTPHACSTSGLLPLFQLHMQHILMLHVFQCGCSLAATAALKCTPFATIMDGYAADFRIKGSTQTQNDCTMYQSVATAVNAADMLLCWVRNYCS